MAGGPDRGDREELAARLALAQVPGIGAVRLHGLLGAFESILGMVPERGLELD